MDMRFFIWAIPFFILSAFHVIACLRQKDHIADISKKLLMPFLIIAVIGFSLFPSTMYEPSSASTIIGDVNDHRSVYFINDFFPYLPTILLCIALFCGMIGDIFLLGKIKNSNLLKGLGAFFIGHLFYITILLLVFPFMPIPLWFVVTALGVYAMAVFGTWCMNKKPNGVIGVSVVTYASLLATFNYITLLLCAGYIFLLQDSLSPFATIQPSLIRIFCGSTLFLVSDSLLSYTIFVGPLKLGRFFVMISYLAAQFFIAWGICTI